MKTEYEPFDVAADYLVSEERIAGYLSAAAEDEDPNVLLLALCDAAKARGMMEVAKAAGLNRESLYKALKPGAHPRFETVQAVLRALGVKLTMSARAGETRDDGGDEAGRLAEEATIALKVMREETSCGSHANALDRRVQAYPPAENLHHSRRRDCAKGRREKARPQKSPRRGGQARNASEKARVTTHEA